MKKMLRFIEKKHAECNEIKISFSFFLIECGKFRNLELETIQENEELSLKTYSDLDFDYFFADKVEMESNEKEKYLLLFSSVIVENNYYEYYSFILEMNCYVNLHKRTNIPKNIEIFYCQDEGTFCIIDRYFFFQPILCEDFNDFLFCIDKVRTIY